jgi:hypothetical protein
MEHTISQLSYTNIDYLNWYCIGIGIVIVSCVNCVGIGISISPECQYCSTVISIALILLKGVQDSLSMAFGVFINYSCVPAEAEGRG